MTDLVDRRTRSRMMAAVRSGNTRPEMRVRMHLHALGLRYRVHVRALPGAPDIVFQKHKTVVFVNGCFWHQHKRCPKATLPRTNQGFWFEKLRGNVRRDTSTTRRLRELGWQVLVIWECETGNLAKLTGLARRIRGPFVKGTRGRRSATLTSTSAGGNREHFRFP